MLHQVYQRCSAGQDVMVLGCAERRIVLANIEYHLTSGDVVLYKIAASYMDNDAKGNFGLLWSVDSSSPNVSPPTPSAVVYLGGGIMIAPAAAAPAPNPIVTGAGETPQWSVLSNGTQLALVIAPSIDTTTNLGQAAFYTAEGVLIVSLTIQPGTIMLRKDFLIP